MISVVDASVAAKWFVREPDSPAAITLLDESDHLFIAPEFICTEILNVIWKRTLRGDVEPAASRLIAERIREPFEELLPVGPLLGSALAIALELRHPVYDCFYLALAEARSAHLVTADRRLHQAVQGTAWAALTRLLA